jgi:hypothetical protein
MYDKIQHKMETDLPRVVFGTKKNRTSLFHGCREKQLKDYFHSHLS